MISSFQIEYLHCSVRILTTNDDNNYTNNSKFTIKQKLIVRSCEEWLSLRNITQ